MWPLLLALYLARCLSGGRALAGLKQSAAANQSYELKFQSELDSSTISKLESQQQIFKCQVKLAPVGGASSGPSARRARLSSTWTQLDEAQWPAQSANSSGDPSRPQNVTLTVDWFKNDRRLEDQLGEQRVSVLNVELRSALAGARNDKRNKSRVEIKNTLNGPQFKLTSRLKLSRLKVEDSGSYKCISRVNFLIPSTAKEQPEMVRVEQSLESNVASLMVLANSSSNLAEAHSEPRAEPKYSLAGSISGTDVQAAGNDTRHESGKGRQQLEDPSDGSAQSARIPNIEDDEDLFKSEQQQQLGSAGDFISGRQQPPISAPANDDQEDNTGANRQPEEPQRDLQPDVWQPKLAADGRDDNNESSAASGAEEKLRRQHRQRAPSVAGPEAGQATPAHSTGHKLAGLVHRIAPELACYTGYGELYRGFASLAADGRRCVRWSQVRHFHLSSRKSLVGDGGEHSFCRNPNSDMRGPWCYVHYSADLDAAAAGAREPSERLSQLAAPNGSSLRLVQRPCDLAPCSDYLYVVAPPAGLLVLLLCLAIALIKSIKRSHYKPVLSAGKRRTLPPFRRLLMSHGRYASKRLGVVGAKKSDAGYLDDDIFEIVDDLDWSDGQAQSMSPKSTSESLRLNSASSCASVTKDLVEGRSPGGCKSVNPIFNERAFEATSQAPAADLMTGPASRSVTQVGPVFATLRCHIRGSLRRGLADQRQQQGSQQNQVNKSTSTFIEQNGASSKSDWHSKRNLISCSTSNSSAVSDSGLDEPSGSNELTTGSYIEGCELPQLNATSISLANEQPQPIYEGKFSQVQLAYLKRDSGDQRLAMASLGNHVALCSVKLNASIDPKMFQPNKLKLRNLNHLNILKLIGYIQTEDHLDLEGSKQTSLVYDMSNLVDLSDWLKQQNKDLLTSSEPGDDLRVRRNLTCFAKQVALAIDYLHDQGIIYKDLACRNCFIDVTKMLIKLASFNLELIIDSNDAATMSLKSMIRPKYLPDYYVIDSRPTDSQLLPLSWIPLESILFNKFNKQTDVWSFGCLIYELFSLGEVAYFGYSSKQVIDAVRSNLIPPQPLMCPSGIYKLMCKCLSDIPTIRPSIKQVYEQLSLYSGQCSSFLDHHLCSLATSMYDDQLVASPIMAGSAQPLELRVHHHQQEARPPIVASASNCNSITKTKSYANMRNFTPTARAYDTDNKDAKQDTARIPLSKSINLCAPNRAQQSNSLSQVRQKAGKHEEDENQYDEPVIGTS